jgi:hypothetical protein
VLGELPFCDRWSWFSLLILVKVLAIQAPSSRRF